MLKRNLSRRNFFGATALGAVAGASILSNPVRAAAEAVGVKPTDLPDLTIKEVKVYVANLGPAIRRINSPESGEIVSIVTNSGIEGNFTLGNRVGGTGWLEYAKSVCLGKNVIDLLPSLGTSSQRTQGGFGGAAGFVGGFGYPRGMRLGSVGETNYHAAIIDYCLWDIFGKTVNRPIYKLLGGTKDKLLAYGSSLHLAAIEDFAPQALQAKADGLKAYKIHPGGGQHQTPTGGVIPAYVGHIEEIREVRKAMGEEFTLLFDPVQRYNVFEALKVGRALEEYGYVSFEDPIPETDIEGLIELRQKLTVPIEVGEFLYSIQAYAEYIRRGALDIVRLIADNVGGISGSFRIGQLADAFGLPCTPHNWGNGFDLAAHFQIELALPNTFWFEMPYPQTLADRPYLKGQFRVDKDGYVNAPRAPGLGVELDRDALDKILTRIDR
ncbi:MAG TPA: mandelate racemase/muconate lactonizing enzyme family protein [Opitutaceae bacterium]|nr:mandelate racemase/muconate lactonizing enzyme family protein [Opitutaceae bacterium]